MLSSCELHSSTQQHSSSSRISLPHSSRDRSIDTEKDGSTRIALAAIASIQKLSRFTHSGMNSIQRWGEQVSGFYHTFATQSVSSSSSATSCALPYLQSSAHSNDALVTCTSVCPLKEVTSMDPLQTSVNAERMWRTEEKGGRKEENLANPLTTPNTEECQCPRKQRPLSRDELMMFSDPADENKLREVNSGSSHSCTFVLSYPKNCLKLCWSL
jgi:hypothetical protein